MLHHIAIICSDKDKALSFYHDKLGFPIIRESYRPERSDWKLDLSLNGSIVSADCELELFIVPSAPSRLSYPEARGLRHLAFRVADVTATLAELERVGIPCEPIRIDAYTGEKMTFFHDPDGLPIEIHG